MAVRGDPFRARRSRGGQREIKKRDPLPVIPAHADSVDPVICEVNALHRHLGTQDYGRERQRQVFFDQRVDGCDLLILAVGVNGCLGDQLIQVCPAQLAHSSKRNDPGVTALLAKPPVPMREKQGAQRRIGAIAWQTMMNLYIVDFSGGPEERARREAERDAERDRLFSRYTRHLVERAGLGGAAAQRAVAALFDPRDREGSRCEFWDSDEAAALREEDQREEQEITAWLAGQPGVQASRTTSMAPEQWEGTIDGHSFYFRERGGCWRIELDLRENGRFAQRLVRVADDGGLVTEPVPVTEGDIIAEGTDSQLGATATGHIAFIVRTVRDHLRRTQCDHAGAARFCPHCGHRTTEAS